jgi:hypothetical protein
VSDPYAEHKLGGAESASAKKCVSTLARGADSSRPAIDVCWPTTPVCWSTMAVCTGPPGVRNRTSAVCTPPWSVCKGTNGTCTLPWVLWNVAPASGPVALGHCGPANIDCGPANIDCGRVLPGSSQHFLVCGAHLGVRGRAYRVVRVANGGVWPANHVGSLIHNPICPFCPLCPLSDWS